MTNIQTSPGGPNAIEERVLPLNVQVDPPDDVDPVAVDIMTTVYTASKLLEEIQEAFATGRFDPTDPPAPLTQAYVDALEDAVRCWQDVVEECDGIPKDIDALDAETLTEIRGTIVYVGRHFGIDIELPTPDAGPRGVTDE